MDFALLELMVKMGRYILNRQFQEDVESAQYYLCPVHYWKGQEGHPVQSGVRAVGIGEEERFLEEVMIGLSPEEE